MGESDRGRPRVPSLTAGRDTDGGVYPDRGDLDAPQERSSAVPEGRPDDDTLARLYRWPEPAEPADPADPAAGVTDAARAMVRACLLYTSDAADEEDSVDLGGR